MDCREAGFEMGQGVVRRHAVRTVSFFVVTNTVVFSTGSKTCIRLQPIHNASSLYAQQSDANKAKLYVCFRFPAWAHKPVKALQCLVVYPCHQPAFCFFTLALQATNTLLKKGFYLPKKFS